MVRCVAEARTNCDPEPVTASRSKMKLSIAKIDRTTCEYSQTSRSRDQSPVILPPTTEKNVALTPSIGIFFVQALFTGCVKDQ
jgi:hypothetical protein